MKLYTFNSKIHSIKEIQLVHKVTIAHILINYNFTFDKLNFTTTSTRGIEDVEIRAIFINLYVNLKKIL